MLAATTFICMQERQILYFSLFLLYIRTLHIYIRHILRVSRRGPVVQCWLIRRKARVRAPGQASKQNTENISLVISSKQISGKNSKKKLKKICRSESTLNCTDL